MIQAAFIVAALCNPQMQWPSVESLAPGGVYTIDCSADVDTVLVGVWQGNNYVVQIVSADLDGACGDQYIAIPNDLPAGEYEFRAEVYSCDDCVSRMPPKVFTVE